MIVHNGTTLSSSFSLVDNDGNVIKTFNLQANSNDDPLFIKRLSETEFLRALQVILAAKKQLTEQEDKSPRPYEIKDSPSTE